MKKLGILFALIGILFAFNGLLTLGACSEAKNAINAEDNIDTITECFPDLFEKVDQLLDIAALWRETEMPENPPNPPGLAATLNGNIIDVTYFLPGTTRQFDMTIRFYDPTGGQFTPTMVTQGPLSQMIDDAATELGPMFAGQDPFMVGAWTYQDGTGGSGSGALTGIIGGVANQNELERLLTSESTPSGGPPPPATATISLMNNAGDTCTAVFNTVASTHLETDTPASQQYPVGQLTISVTGPKATVGVTVAFDGTVNAVISTSVLPADFNLNLETFDVDYTG